MSDEEWSCEKTIDELQCNLAAVEQKVTNHGGQVIMIRKYQSLCRRLGRYIPVAEPTPEYPICLSDLKLEVRKALEFYHPELTRAGPASCFKTFRSCRNRAVYQHWTKTRREINRRSECIVIIRNL